MCMVLLRLLYNQSSRFQASFLSYRPFPVPPPLPPIFWLLWFFFVHLTYVRSLPAIFYFLSTLLYIHFRTRAVDCLDCHARVKDLRTPISQFPYQIRLVPFVFRCSFSFSFVLHIDLCPGQGRCSSRINDSCTCKNRKISSGGRLPECLPYLYDKF